MQFMKNFFLLIEGVNGGLLRQLRLNLTDFDG